MPRGQTRTVTTTVTKRVAREQADAMRPVQILLDATNIGGGDHTSSGIPDLDADGRITQQDLNNYLMAGGGEGRPPIVSPTPPTQYIDGGPLAKGDLWINDADDQLSYWDGSDWVLLSNSDGTRLPIVSDSEPADHPTAGPLLEGDLWVNSDTSELSYWDGTDWVLLAGGGTSEIPEPPADDEPYARVCPSTQADPSKPVGEWLKLNHLDSAKFWVRNSSDPNFTEADGVRPNDVQYVPDTDKLFLYRDVFGDQSAYYWVQMLYTPPDGSGGGIPEAPKNGEPYVRIDGSWQKLSDFGAGGGGPFVGSVSVNPPIKDAGSATSPDLGVDLTTLPPSS